MDNLKLINDKIAENYDEMIKTLQELVMINSERTTPEKDKPFGKGVQDAFIYMLEKGEQDGFLATNIDNYGGHIDMPCGNEKAETMGILAHLDVVPAGDGWDYEPYGAEIIDGKMYGRGTSDDKGPSIAAYFAMRAIKDAGIKLSKNVRLILGLDEETGWDGMYYYLSKIPKPADFGFTPDGDFPAVHGEMGILNFDIAKKFTKSVGKGIELRSFKGGNAHNMVPDYARVVLRSDKPKVYENLKVKAAKWREEGVKIKAKGVGKSFEITVEGKSAHGSTPEKGTNAISILMDFIKDIEFNNESINDFIEFYNEEIGFQLDGTNLGICLEDEVSGKTVVNIGVIELDTKSARLAVNVRYPVTFGENDIYDNLDSVLTKYNIGIVKKMSQNPIYMEKDNPLIVTMMDVYKRITGDIDAKPQVMGGGTYARALENFVAFGALFPGEEELFHQKNEFMSLESLKKTTQIYAETIYELCK